MTALNSANRCTPCMEGDHRRCTGSAGNVGCGCIHADWPATPGGGLDVERVEAERPVPVLDPAIVRERLTELDRRVEVQQLLVDRLDSLLDDEQRELIGLQREVRELRAQPAVIKALQTDHRKDTHA